DPAGSTAGRGVKGDRAPSSLGLWRRRCPRSRADARPRGGTRGRPRTPPADGAKPVQASGPGVVPFSVLAGQPSALLRPGSGAGVPAGSSVRWARGEAKEIGLVRYGGQEASHDDTA